MLSCGHNVVDCCYINYHSLIGGLMGPLRQTPFQINRRKCIEIDTNYSIKDVNFLSKCFFFFMLGV